MKPILILPFLVISLQALFAQQKTEVYIGMPDRMDYAEGVMEHYDKGYFILGGFEYENGWTIKTDVNLEPLWDFVFEFPSLPVYVKGSVNDGEGNLYVCGSVDSWPFVAKLNSCGEKIWCKVFKLEDEFDFGYSKDILLNQNNEIILLTYYNSDGDDEINITHLIGIEDTGNVLWKKPYASRNDHSWIRQPIGVDLKEVDNEYYISGDCYYPYPDDTTHWFLRPLFIGIDSLFDEKWILPYAPLDSIFGTSFNTVPLNDSVLMGVGYRLSGSEIYNTILLFYDLNGIELGHTQFSNESIGNNIDFNAIRDIKRINDTLFISPYYLGIGDETYFGEFVFDTSGVIHNQITRDIYEGNSSIAKSSDDNFVIAIEVEETKGDDDIYVYKINQNLNDVPFDPTPHNYDSLCPGGIQSGTTDLTDCFIWTDISEAPSPGEFYASVKKIPVVAYPNPASTGNVTFAFQNTKYHYKMQLQCFNVFGELVHKEKIYRYQEESKVNTIAWQKGMYVVVLYSDGLPVGECKFVVQ